jgi:hypothetical protein
VTDGVLYAAAGLWLAIGAAVAVLLLRQGHPAETVLMTLVAWPLTVPLLGGEAPRLLPGPLGARVEAAVARLHATLGEGPHTADLAAVRAQLLRTDARLARLDTLLADPGDLPDADVRALREDRARTEATILRAVEELGRLRVRAGLAGLEPEPGANDGPFADLMARVAALDEVAGDAAVRADA